MLLKNPQMAAIRISHTHQNTWTRKIEENVIPRRAGYTPAVFAKVAWARVGPRIGKYRRENIRPPRERVYVRPQGRREGERAMAI